MSQFQFLAILRLVRLGDLSQYLAVVSYGNHVLVPFLRWPEIETFTLLVRFIEILKINFKHLLRLFIRVNDNGDDNKFHRKV